MSYYPDENSHIKHKFEDLSGFPIMLLKKN